MEFWTAGIGVIAVVAKLNRPFDVMLPCRWRTFRFIDRGCRSPLTYVKPVSSASAEGKTSERRVAAKRTTSFGRIINQRPVGSRERSDDTSADQTLTDGSFYRRCSKLLHRGAPEALQKLGSRIPSPGVN
ncbi:hypothetical protein ZHAS_00005180 [Anopheles sinensis]|uniref:Uncharacterized protein n=1 Tax=Anopheles sinensis TaxID=74873 RepID=A0A084VIS0_ANOSI|nr:hypothetical protein ZHAS_00005180 [Anopheles sinensis]